MSTIAKREVKKKDAIDLLYDWFRSKARDSDDDDDEAEISITLPKLRKLINLVVDIAKEGVDLGESVSSLWKCLDRII